MLPIELTCVKICVASPPDSRGTLMLVRMPGQTFFRTMQRKLNWAVRPPERA